MKEFGAIDASGKHPRDAHASSGEKRSASGTSSGEWLVNVSGEVVVPMTSSEIAIGVRAGTLSDRSLVWRIGMHDWTILGDVPQLRLATGRSTAPPPASTTRVVAQPPSATQAESQRRRNTLPFGFPAVRDPASIRQPVGLSAPPAAATTISAPRSVTPARPQEEEVTALAVYDRPAASLTFSDSVRAEWQGTSRIVHQAQPSTPPIARSVTPPAMPKLSPAPVVAARLPQAARSGFPNSLAPIASDAKNIPDSRAPSAWGDRSVVFASELRAVKATTKRIALWAAVGSAAVASVFTLWLMRGPAPHPAEAALPAAPKVAAQPISLAPLETLAPPLPASAATAAAPKRAASAPRAAAKRAARPKPAPVIAAPVDDPQSASDNPYAQVSEASVATPAAASEPPATLTPAANVESAPPSAPAPIPSPAARADQPGF